MTRQLNRPLLDQMELDLDAFLASRTATDTGASENDGDDDDDIPHRTVDEILLNDSDSGSYSPPSPSPLHNSFLRRHGDNDDDDDSENGDARSRGHDTAPVQNPKTLSQSRADETLRSLPFGESKSGFGSIDRTVKSGDSFTLGGRRSALHAFPPLFGGVRSTAKPGAALAAAAAASRSIPTPHAAAIKSRRAISSTFRDGLLEELGLEVVDSEFSLSEAAGSFDGAGCEVSQSDVQLVEKDVHYDDSQSIGGELTTNGEVNGEIFSREQEIRETSNESGGAPSVEQTQEEPAQGTTVDLLRINNSNQVLSSSYMGPHIDHPPKTGQDLDLDLKEKTSALIPKDFKDERVPSPAADEICCGDVSDLTAASESREKGITSSPRSENGRKTEDELAIVASETSEPGWTTPHSRVGGTSLAEDDIGSTIDVIGLVEEDQGSPWERKSSSGTEKKSRPPLKPLELAEELEQKHAFSILDLENDIAAQPMRLEGVRRGSTALGYFDVNAKNTITWTISSQAFRRDHGSPQVVAVHLNFIAVGMSKGVVVAVPSKYSSHFADNMDAKILILGSQGDNSHSPVTAMCFNQQGDLLFAGYGNGQITVWDLQKGSAIKVITGIHDAPVVHMLYLGQDSQVTRQVSRQFRVVSGDSKGLVWLITFTLVPWVNRLSYSTTCLLDGRTTGKALCASSLLSDEFCGGALMSQGNATGSSSGISSMMGGVLGGDASWKFLNEKSSLVEDGVIIFATYQHALVARVSPSVVVYAQLSRPDGVREGSMPYTAWKCMGQQQISSSEDMPKEASEKVSLLAIAWDRKVQVAKLVKSELKIYGKWTLESSAIGVEWLDDQMLVVLTSNGQLCLFSKDGTIIHQTSFNVDGSEGDDLVSYHTQFSNVFGNPEKAYHNSVAVRGASIYILGPMHLVVCRLLPWKERILVLRKAGDWMGALNMAMTLYDGQAHGVIDLPRSMEAVQEAIMPYLVELLVSYVDEVFSYISVAFCNQIEKVEKMDDSESRASSVHSEIKEQFTRVGGVAVEFCVHIKRTDVLFDEVLSKFVAVKQRDTFLELLEPYILKDMLGSLPPEIMQALVEHYSMKGWLQRVEQCVLHMDISSLDFNQVVRLCREHRLYSALVYLFNRGLDDFRSPLEELLIVFLNSQRDAAAALGYRMLVYLKYCFSGLAFPPGHGTLPPTRLPSLRIELVQFLLEDSNAPNSLTNTSNLSTEAYLNLYHLLELDAEATLDVLRCAFVEDEIPYSDHSHDSINRNMEAEEENDSVAASQNVLVQKTVDALIYVISKGSLKTNNSTSSGGVGFSERWPSKKDIGLIFEFISYYVSWKKANVSSNILSQILEYFTYDGNLPPSVSRQTVEASRKREKQVLALLEVVPETDWDASYLLKLCEGAQFYQVCGLIHAIRHQYVAALDSYMKDFDEPIHAFSFINDTLQKPSDTEADSFRSAVISRIPDLITLSREGTFLLVIDHFSTESQHILSELEPHPKSLFLYLKAVFEVHLSGTLDFSCLRKGESLEFHHGRSRKDQSMETYLGRISDLPKLLRNNPVQVTDEMIELYLELLCQFERGSVLMFLETFENYRVEHCLRLCQEYGIIDAAAFLLERVGDVGGALLLTLSNLNEKFTILDSSVVADASMEHFSTVLKKQEVNDILDILHACVGLCQRNTPRLDPEESESLWFRLLDSFCEPLMDSLDDKVGFEGENQYMMRAESMGMQEFDEACIIKWKIPKFHNSAQILRKLFALFIKEIVEGMIGYVRLPTIMSKLLSDNGSQEFGDFKVTILGMLGIYGFERRILDTAKSLIEDDTFYIMSLLKKGASRGYAPRSLLCSICNCLLSKFSSGSGIRVFNCGHAIHVQCELPENDILSASYSNGCPVCLPKKKGQRSRSKALLTENGLVSKSLSKQPQAHGNISTHPHENDALENSYGSQQISRFEILTNLQKDQRLIQIENRPPLRLAPPALYHEKVKKGNDHMAESSSDGLTTVEKPSKSRQLQELKAKGSSLRLSNINPNVFGKEKSSGKRWNKKLL
ncbi:uncharacterized protein LOC127787181 [Diospyros lotus]|uniref:uncharacterized protein LOC127787181 n=1 Tax=Diospyros lotus TaxID=55363 RepID=UPI002251715D|nr:uncharacterized protein LOC127787181 [Diospyros lotus]XP_052171049.1 uncharacterized protein LOC127787181 [Diospyros lotus]